jgi:histidyl-tRNA synthetase
MESSNTTKNTTEENKFNQETDENLNQVVKGCQDYSPEIWQKIQYVISILRQVASQFEIPEIETPIREYKSLLLDKYGEDAETKLIFDLADGKTAMRYDLTIPFTRYVMNNGLDNFSRLQIGRVFRRDAPYPSKGRFCEFFQGDIDIVGDREEMVAEAEILRIINTVIKSLGLSGYYIKINFCQNLEKIFRKIGVETSNKKYFKSLCSSIDKLDKHEWNYVAQELQTKHLTQEQCFQLKELFSSNYLDKTVEPVYQKLGKYTKFFQVENIIFDSTLARGLDYYTGLIYEVVFPGTDIGSVIAGGRYDKLIYKTKNKSRVYTPAIGVSFGISRLVLMMKQEIKTKDFRIYIVADSKNLDKKLEIANILMNAGFNVKYNDKPQKNIKEINYGIKNNYNFVIIYGENNEFICVKRNDKSTDQICTIDKLVHTIKNFDTLLNYTMSDSDAEHFDSHSEFDAK